MNHFALRPTLAAALLVLASTPAVARAPSGAYATADPRLAARLDLYLRSVYPINEPGAAVIVVRDGEVVWRGAYGLADLEHGTKTTPETIFRIGSLTKQFTAALVLGLEAEGKLSVSDPLSRHLPDYDGPARDVTIEQLLTHTGGVPNYTGLPGAREHERDDLTVEQLLARFRDLPLAFAPGTQFAYGNSSYVLLGAVIEKVTGKPYREALAERLFSKLGMTRSAYDDPAAIVADRATGYERDGDRFVHAKPVSPTQSYAAGAIASTVDDLARWDAALDGDGVIPAAARDRAWTSHRLADGTETRYGYGWIVGTYHGARVLEGMGGLPGFSSYTLRLETPRLFVAVLSNAGGQRSHPSLVPRHLADLAAGHGVERRPVPILAGNMLDRFAGTYVAADTTSWKIAAGDGVLLVRHMQTPELRALPASALDFYAEHALLDLHFEVDAEGKVVALRIGLWGKEDVVATRAPASP